MRCEGSRQFQGRQGPCGYTDAHARNLGYESQLSAHSVHGSKMNISRAWFLRAKAKLRNPHCPIHNPLPTYVPQSFAHIGPIMIVHCSIMGLQLPRIICPWRIISPSPFSASIPYIGSKVYVAYAQLCSTCQCVDYVNAWLLCVVVVDYDNYTSALYMTIHLGSCSGRLCAL